MRVETTPWTNSYYCFEMKPSDGTRYTVHLCPCEHGGIYVLVNDSSCWLWFEGETSHDHEVKFLFGNNNEYTKKAVYTIMNKHWEKWME